VSVESAEGTSPLSNCALQNKIDEMPYARTPGIRTAVQNQIKRKMKQKQAGTNSAKKDFPRKRRISFAQV
jgi:hypothetical protein